MSAPWALPWVMGGAGCPGMMGKPMGHWPMGAPMMPMGGYCPGAYTSEGAGIV